MACMDPVLWKIALTFFQLKQPLVLHFALPKALFAHSASSYGNGQTNMTC